MYWLITLAIIAAISVYQDLTTNKIRNWVIILGAITGLALFGTSNLLQAFIALGVGFLLFAVDLWSPGDAKLFAVYTLLIPIEFYDKFLMPTFPALSILMNAMIPAAVFYTLHAFARTTFKQQKVAFLKLDHGSLAFTILIFFIVNYAFSFFTLHQALSLLLEIIVVMTVLKLIEYEHGWLIGSVVAFIGCYKWDTLTMFPMALLTILVYILLAWLIQVSSVAFRRKNISEKIPFATWMALGILLTIILKTDLISYINYI
ncbi:MAG: prepilin peptidase [Candidatus Nanoarchaeia archaeon]